MSLTSTVVVTFIKNNYRSKSATIVSLLLALIFSVILTILGMSFFILPQLDSAAPDIDKITNILGLIVYSTCLCCLGMNINTFTAKPLIIEKSGKTLEALMATSLTAKQIWIARSLAVFIPGFVISEVVSLISFLIINVFFIGPKIGFLISPWMVFNGFFVLQLMYFALNLLVHIVALTGNPISGNAIAQTTFPVIGSLMINLGVRYIWSTNSWIFALMNLICFVAIIFLVFIFQPLVTKENITISNK